MATTHERPQLVRLQSARNIFILHGNLELISIHNNSTPTHTHTKYGNTSLNDKISFSSIKPSCLRFCLALNHPLFESLYTIHTRQYISMIYMCVCV